MFVMLIATVIVALGVSALVVMLFRQALGAVLKRIIADEIYLAWLKFLQFAVLVVGVTGGVRIREIEKYMTPVRGEKDARLLEFTFERWTMELYRTAAETLESITWMLLVFFVFAMVAYVIVRIAELKFGPTQGWVSPVQAAKAPQLAGTDHALSSDVAP